jgi:hypothetical protein
MRLLLLLALSSYAAEPSIILGVLEEIPGSYVADTPHRAIRPVFQKQGREWQPFTPDQLPTHTWTIAFSGRNLGQVTGTNSADSLQSITNQDVPTIGKRSKEFSGFLGTPVLRPLIANSQPYFKDPDNWRPSHASPEVTASARLAFRKKFPEVTNCLSQDHETQKPWQYRDVDMKLNKAYASIHNWSVVEILLTGNRCLEIPDDWFIDQWFAVTPGGATIFLGAGMWLVDAGDYDESGNSDLVFAIDRYNQGGYELFYDNFKGHTVFEFSYH